MARTKMIPAEQRTVIVFDLHDVVLKDMYSIAYKTFLTHLLWIRYNTKLIMSLILFGINKKIKTFNTQKLCVERAVLDGVTDEVYKNYALTIVNPHVIDKSTTHFIYELGAHKFLRFAFSNLGEESLPYIRGSEEFDALFDGKYICNAHDGYVTKASPEAFKNILIKVIIPTFQQKYPGQLPETIIVIDDSPKKLAIMQKGLEELQQIHPELQNTKLAPIQFKNIAQMETDVRALLT
jgi:hypothetical protein